MSVQQDRFSVSSTAPARAAFFSITFFYPGAVDAQVRGHAADCNNPDGTAINNAIGVLWDADTKL